MGDRARHKFLKVAASLSAGLVASATLAACGNSGGGVPVINLYGGTSDVGFDDGPGSVIDTCNKQADGKYKIVGNLLPSDADGQREQFVRRLAAKDEGLDLLGMDVTWTAEFAEAGWIRELTDAQKEAATADTLQPTIDTAMWKDKLYGIPKHTNVQLLWFRKSLVPTPPKTWDEMLAMSKKLKAEGKPYVIGLTAAQYEGYVVGFSTILSSLGGTLVNKDSTKVTVDDKTVEALKILKELATSGLASKSLSNSQEPEVFASMQNNEAAFIINWPYVLSAMKEADPKIAADLGYTKLPEFKAGMAPTATLGGMNFAISTYSKHPKEAFDAAMCMRSPEIQLKIAIKAGEPPRGTERLRQPGVQEGLPDGPGDARRAQDG